MRIIITSARFWANAGTLPATLDLFQPHPHQGRLEISRFDWTEVRSLLVAACGGEEEFQKAAKVVKDRVGEDLRAAEDEPLEAAIDRLDILGLALAAKHLTNTLNEATRTRDRAEADQARTLVVDRLESLAGEEIARLRARRPLTGSPLTERERGALRRYIAAGL